MSDPRRFGESKRHEAWDKPGGFTFYHKPKLPPFEFAELDLSAAQAERVRQAAAWYLALKQAVPSNTKMLERASKARRKLKAAEKVAREAARTAKQAARVAEEAATEAANEAATEAAKRAARKHAWKLAWRTVLWQNDPKRVLDEIAHHAAALADLLASKGAAESVFTALQVKGPDPNELIMDLGAVEHAAVAAWERRRNIGQKPQAVAEFEFIGRLAEIYEAAGGKIRTVRDVPTIDERDDVLNHTELSDTPWVRFLLAAFAYAGTEVPSSSTINRAVSEARPKTG